MEHTKSEIRVSSSNPESIYVLKNGKADGLFAMCDAGDYARSQKEGFANAKELVRRWNAFEDDGLVDELRAACDEGKAECELAMTDCRCEHKDIAGLLLRIERIEAAIAKVT